MKNKNLIYIVGGVAVLGIAYYMYKKRQGKAKSETPVTPVAETKSEDETKVEDDTAGVVAKPKMESSTETNPLQGKPANPNAMQVAQSMPKTTATPPASTPKTQLTKNEVELRLFKKCGVKPLLNIKGSVQKYENCKNSFKNNLRKQGLISFDGMDTYSYMTSDFEISFR